MGQQYEILATPEKGRAMSCLGCGALVVRTTVHDNWHSRLGLWDRILHILARLAPSVLHHPRQTAVTREDYDVLEAFAREEGGS